MVIHRWRSQLINFRTMDYNYYTKWITRTHATAPKSKQLLPKLKVNSDRCNSAESVEPAKQLTETKATTKHCPAAKNILGIIYKRILFCLKPRFRTDQLISTLPASSSITSLRIKGQAHYLKTSRKTLIVLISTCRNECWTLVTSMIYKLISLLIWQRNLCFNQKAKNLNLKICNLNECWQRIPCAAAQSKSTANLISKENLNQQTNRTSFCSRHILRSSNRSNTDTPWLRNAYIIDSNSMRNSIC